MRLIDADVMRDDWLYNGQNEYVYDTNAVLDSIDEQPTIDPESLRPHGKWIESPSTVPFQTYKCSVCGCEILYEDTKYCPYCGAKMEGFEGT